MQRVKEKRRAGLRAVRLRILRDLKKYRLAVPAFLLYAVLTTVFLGTICPLSALTGFPCPGCGSTRALFLVLTGRWSAAFYYSPCIFLWMLLAVYAGWQRYVRGKRAAGALPAAAGIAALMLFVYLYRMAAEFPGSPPMDYREENVLARLLPAYGGLMRRLFS